MSWDDDEFYDLSFSIEKCRRYHAKLRDHYQRIHDLTTAANVVAGSGTFIAVLGALPIVAGALSGVVAIASLLDLVFRTDRKAQLHHDLCGRFTELAAKIEITPATADNLAALRAERLLIEKDEPSEKRLVENMAHNDTSRARGVPEADLIPLSSAQKRFGYFLNFDMDRLEKWNLNRSQS